MVLGRRFKLYFILCVWDRMAATGNSNTNNSNTNIENYGNVVTTHSERDNNAKFLESILKSLFTYKSLIHPQYIKKQIENGTIQYLTILKTTLNF